MTVNPRTTVKLLLEGFCAFIIYQICINTCTKILGLNSSPTASAMPAAGNVTFQSPWNVCNTGLQRTLTVSKSLVHRFQWLANRSQWLVKTSCFTKTSTILGKRVSGFHQYHLRFRLSDVVLRTNQKDFFWNKGGHSDPNISKGSQSICRLKHDCYMKAEPK